MKRSERQPKTNPWPGVIATVFSQPNAHRLVRALFVGPAMLLLACAMAYGSCSQRGVNEPNVTSLRAAMALWHWPALLDFVDPAFLTEPLLPRSRDTLSADTAGGARIKRRSSRSRTEDGCHSSRVRYYLTRLPALPNAGRPVTLASTAYGDAGAIRKKACYRWQPIQAFWAGSQTGATPGRHQCSPRQISIAYNMRSGHPMRRSTPCAHRNSASCPSRRPAHHRPPNS